MLQKECGIKLLTAQKLINRQVGGKEILLYFICWQLGRKAGKANICPKANSSSGNQWGKGFSFFFFKERRKGLPAKTEQSALTVIFKLAIGGLTSVILVVLGTVNIFSFRVHLFPFLWSQFSELWQLMLWVQSGNLVVNFSTWCFTVYKTAHRIWLRILFIALEKELKVLDCA